MNVLTFDIGGKSVKYAIFNNNKIIGEVKNVEIKEANKKDVIKIIKDIYTKNVEKIEGIAVSAPGSILASGYVNGITAIKDFNDFNLIDTLKQELNFDKSIKAINDGNAIAYADYSQVEKGTSIATLAIGTGIGAGIVIGGNLVFGKDGFGGEAGMMITHAPNNDQNFKPFTGSWTSGFYHMEKYYTKLSGKELEGKDIFALYDKQDQHALEAIDRMYRGIAILVFNIAVLINPHYIFIGGGLSKRKQSPKEIMEYVKKLHNNLNLKINLVNIKNSPFGWEGQLWGAYNYFLDNQEK